MKKLLLTLSLVLGFITLAQAADVTMPESGKKWTDYGSTSPITVQGYSFAYTNGKMYDSDFRLYSGATLTITAPEGKSFTKVVVKAASDNEAAKATLAGSNANAWKVSASGSGQNLVVTFEATSPQTSLAFKGATSTGGNKQFKIGTFTITEEGGEDVPSVVKEPTFSVASGEVKAGTEVRISCATDGATIYYTIDNSTPSESNGTEYYAPIVINKDMTIKAIAVKDGMTPSSVATATYTIKEENPDASSASFIFGGTGAMTSFDGATVGTSQAASGSNNLNGKSETVNNVTLSFSVSTGTNTRWWQANKGNEVRVYDGGAFTISVPDDYIIESIVFDHQNSTTFNATLSSGTLGKIADKKRDWTPTEAVSSVTFTTNASATTKQMNFSAVTVNYAKVGSKPAAPVLTMPEGYNADTPVNLTEYSNGEKKYFDVTVTWTEGMKLVYTVSARGTMLNGTPLVYPEQPKEESTPAAVRANGPAKAALENHVKGTISGASSAVFSFASDGEFSCWVEDADGNKSRTVKMTFQGQSTGVEDIIANGADDSEAVYYNLQGVRVANPAAGNLYIKVQGDKATKVLVK